MVFLTQLFDMFFQGQDSYLVFRASKSSITKRHCFRHADLVKYSSFCISLNIPVSLWNLIIFSTSHFFPSSVLISPWILCFFLLSLYWRQSCRQCLYVSICFLHAAFLQVGGGSILDIRCPCDSLEYPIRFLLSLTSYWLQLLYALSYSSMRGLI